MLPSFASSCLRSLNTSMRAYYASGKAGMVHEYPIKQYHRRCAAEAGEGLKKLWRGFVGVYFLLGMSWLHKVCTHSTVTEVCVLGL